MPKVKKGKSKLKPSDGFGPVEKRKVRNAVRQLWHRSHARKLCVARCTDKDGWTYCEDCKKRTPKLKVDHVKRVGVVDSGFLRRMFVPSKYLKGLCKKCHDAKTKVEKQQDKQIDLNDMGF